MRAAITQRGLAISVYSKAHRLQPANPIILSNRSAAFCHYSQHLRNRPAALSEIDALSGMDPTIHAELALKDAERVLKIQTDWPKSYYRKAMALILVRRIMEGSHRMGMVGIDSGTSSVADVACEVEICDCEPLPDGRFLLQVEGRRRFRIIKSWDQDGYRVAEVEWITDICPPDGTKEKEDLQQMAKGAADLARSWIRQAGEAAQACTSLDFVYSAKLLSCFFVSRNSKSFIIAEAAAYITVTCTVA